MPSIITLNVVDGSLPEEQFAFAEPARVLVGRSNACDVRLPSDPMHWDVSRRHCLIAALGPCVTIRDVGSRNGTYVNGQKIGQRASFLPAEEARDAFSPPHRLCDGDRIRIGQTTFQVEVYQDAAAVEAGTNAPAGEPALVG